MMESNNLLTLGMLKVNDRVVVSGYQKGKKILVEKLLAMGITKGAVIKILRFAPLGDPVDIEVKGTSLSLRKEEAEVILVRRK